MSVWMSFGLGLLKEFLEPLIVDLIKQLFWVPTQEKVQDAESPTAPSPIIFAHPF